MITIRVARSDDRSEILAIDHIATHDPVRVAFVDRALRSHVSVIAEVRGEIVGYGVLEYTFFGCGFISMIYVNERDRRQGVGTALLEALAERCTTRKLFTSTNESNGPMKELLRRLEYVPSGVIHNLDPGDPELIYFKDRGTSGAA